MEIRRDIYLDKLISKKHNKCYSNKFLQFLQLFAFARQEVEAVTITA